MSKVLCDPKILKCYVWSILLYMDGWILKKESCRRVQAFEIISWRQFISNAQVLITKGQMPTETNDNRHTKKVAFFGHLQRRSLFEFPRLILEGKITGKRAPGRPRKKWFDDIRETE
ncbi:jg15585 [Pararge aegeria aegeria]|uniref:Jg15585 protein n=1 Tax=Pararge aegeria aegeria TaxID=348720 RepID=A0A8S4RVD4_9NEOP|nr:jg15585 [Pararge aegeria aegeria]